MKLALFYFFTFFACILQDALYNCAISLYNRAKFMQYIGPRDSIDLSSTFNTKKGITHYSIILAPRKKINWGEQDCQCFEENWKRILKECYVLQLWLIKPTGTLYISSLHLKCGNSLIFFDLILFFQYNTN